MRARGSCIRCCRVSGGQSGFTLTELMIVLVIVAVLLGLVVPGFRNVTLATRLTNYANEFVGGVYTARGEAIKRNASVRLCASADAASCAASGGWAQGWIVIDPNDVVIKEYSALENGFSLVEASSTHTMTFDSTGRVDTATSFKLCRQTPSVGHQERQLTVSVLGRSNVTRTSTGTCP